VGGKKRPERGLACRAHPKGCNEEKDPEGVVSRGAMTLGGSAAHPVSFRSRHKQRRCARTVYSNLFVQHSLERPAN